MLSIYLGHLICPTPLDFCKMPISISILISPFAAIFLQRGLDFSTGGFQQKRLKGMKNLQILCTGQRPEASDVRRNLRSAREHQSPL